MGTGSSKSKPDNSQKENLKKGDLRYFFKNIQLHEQGINAVCMTPDGSKIITAGEDQKVGIVDTTSDEVFTVLQGHDSYINHVVCNNKFVFTASADHCIKKWRIDTEICSTFKGHTGAVNKLVLVKTVLFSSSYDCTARCWHIESGECIGVYSGHQRGIYPILYVPQSTDSVDRDYSDLKSNNDVLVTGSYDNTARSWRLGTGESLVLFKGHEGGVLTLACDGNGKRLFTGSSDYSMRSYDLITGTPYKLYEGHQAAVLQILVINRLTFSASADHTVRCWLTEFGDCTRIYRGHQHTVTCMDINDELLITSSGDKTARVYDVRSGVCKRIFKGHTGAVNGFIIYENKLYTVSNDGTIRIYDASKLKKYEYIVEESDDEETDEETGNRENKENEFEVRSE